MKVMRLMRLPGLGIWLGFLCICLYALPAAAVTLDGSWSGSGSVKPKSGQRERVRCRASYTRVTSKIFRVSATCASASATIRQSGEVLLVRPNVYVGNFYNRQFDISGRIRIVVSGSRQTVTLTSRAGSGRLRLGKR